MKSIFVTGTGRSGTTLLTAILAATGFFIPHFQGFDAFKIPDTAETAVTGTPDSAEMAPTGAEAPDTVESTGTGPVSAESASTGAEAEVPDSVKSTPTGTPDPAVAESATTGNPAVVDFTPPGKRHVYQLTIEDIVSSDGALELTGCSQCIHWDECKIRRRLNCRALIMACSIRETANGKELSEVIRGYLFDVKKPNHKTY